MMVSSEKCWEEQNDVLWNNFLGITWSSYVHFRKRTTHLHKEKDLSRYQILSVPYKGSYSRTFIKEGPISGFKRGNYRLFWVVSGVISGK